MSERKLCKADVTVFTGTWRISHALSGPRGRGNWGFRLSNNVGAPSLAEFWPGGLLSYTEAKKRAVAEAARMGFLHVEVLP